MILGYPRSGLVLGLKLERSKVKVTVKVNNNTHWFELYECLLVMYIITLNKNDDIDIEVFLTIPYQ